ncbi:response regulator transcription factor [Aliiglaciecola sp. CAU 1673]|uniref:response regulator transcription factor n=1 Tax=Aliiglaciecola sp. CAU 1673 TaxID=3032595 RepID=UPI0023DA7EC6|nr:response regulator transcription factor [Aliiglaciecola sp. CAU 1673]MDF2178113.1 response regulator transcription factor [Aliiglaciecola sp. CAU 1673]
MLKLLIVEDNRDIALNLADYFGPLGWTLDFAEDGKQGLGLALSQYYDVVVLDLMLPKLDGWQVCRALREQAKRHVPVLMLTARDSLSDKVQGFELGADDYLTKPFALEELKVRCLALANRHQLQQPHLLELGELSLDRRSARVTRQGRDIELNAIPYQILLILASNYPRVVGKLELSERIWGDEPTESDALKSHIYLLRQALDKPFSTPLIRTVHGIGYTLDIHENA